jgi:hypothetical protein
MLAVPGNRTDYDDGSCTFHVSEITRAMHTGRVKRVSTFAA